MSKPFGRVYTRVKKLVADHGGTMTWRPSPPGGWWDIAVDAGRLPVRVENHEINDLDSLYQQPSPAPEVWEDFPLGEDTPLKTNAFELLMALIKERGTPA